MIFNGELKYLIGNEHGFTDSVLYGILLCAGLDSILDTGVRERRW